MSITLSGNHSRGYLGKGSRGQGSQNVTVGIGWLMATASEAGDVAYFQLGDLLANNNLTQGVFFQSEAGATIDFTLCNPGLAMSPDPDDQASVLWTNSLTVPTGTITPADLVFTCARITFTAPGTVYVGAR